MAGTFVVRWRLRPAMHRQYPTTSAVADAMATREHKAFIVSLRTSCSIRRVEQTDCQAIDCLLSCGLGLRNKEACAAPLWILVVCGAWISAAALAAQTSQPSSPPRHPATPCRIEGHVSSGQTPLPGVSVLVQEDGLTKAETSTAVDGAYAIALGPGAVYHLTAELTAFIRVERDVTIDDPPCDLKVDFELALAPRDAGLASGAASTSTSAPPLPSTPNAGRARRQALAPDFKQSAFSRTPTYQWKELHPKTRPMSRVCFLLGSRCKAHASEAIAINGNTNATSLDRGQLNDRLQAIRLGAIDPVTGQVTGIAGPLSANGAGFPGDLDGRGRGGRGELSWSVRPRRTRRKCARRTRGGGSEPVPGLDDVYLRWFRTRYRTVPNSGRTCPSTSRRSPQNNFGATFGGPVKIPGLYANNNGRTNFQVNYTGTSPASCSTSTPPSLTKRCVAATFRRAHSRSSIPKPDGRFRTTRFQRRKSIRARSS